MEDSIQSLLQAARAKGQRRTDVRLRAAIAVILHSIGVPKMTVAKVVDRNRQCVIAYIRNHPVDFQYDEEYRHIYVDMCARLGIPPIS